jgi:hypothetical protein
MFSSVVIIDKGSNRCACVLMPAFKSRWGQNNFHRETGERAGVLTEKKGSRPSAPLTLASPSQFFSLPPTLSSLSPVLVSFLLL